MAKYLIVEKTDLPPAELTEGKNLKAAVAKYGGKPGDVLTVWRIASGPSQVNVVEKKSTVYDIQENTGGSWETGEEE